MDKTMKDILMYMINNFYDNICDIAGDGVVLQKKHSFIYHV